MIIMRMDGVGFSKFTKPFKKDEEFNHRISDSMEQAALELVSRVDTALLAFTISDEITLVLREDKDPWYASRPEKLVSITASIVSVAFNKALDYNIPAYFDSRIVASGVNEERVIQELVDRRDNGFSNAISSAATREFGHRKLQGVPTVDRVRMLNDVGVFIPEVHLYGTVLALEKKILNLTYIDKRTDTEMEAEDVVRTVIRAYRGFDSKAFVW